jgi:protease-4
MKQFFGAFFGSIIGIIVAVVLAAILTVAAVKSSINSALKHDQDVEGAVHGNTVLKINLEGRLAEREKDNPLSELGDIGPFKSNEELGLNRTIKKIKDAAADDNVKGIFICIKRFQAGFASLQELRNALVNFRKSGKFIYTYGESFSEKDFYLASASSKVFLNPQGSIDWRGLSMNLLFFQGAFEKLDVEMQVFRHGKFKSAIEPIILDKMSEANRLQSETFLNSLWSNMLGQIAADRGISTQELNGFANDLSMRFPENALGKLVDRLSYEDEVVAEIKKKIGVKADDKYKFTEFSKYDGKSTANLKAGKIAVIYANGSIGSGEGSDDEIGSDRLARTIREARLEEKVKAIVLRVNSPGGSALASDVIWREVVLAKAAKPTVVSMGDLAASGGYYISCAADRIFAQPNTLTGSIGVFGIIPNLQKMLQSKLGITVDTVNTNKYSDLGALRRLTEKEADFVQSSVEKVYDTFTKKVAEGRKMSQAQVDSIGQGRVWSGSDALKINLVDELGGLGDAIKYAAARAKISDYKIQELPRQKNPFDGFLGKKESEFETRMLQKNLGSMYIYLKQVQQLITLEGVQARLPFEMLID